MSNESQKKYWTSLAEKEGSSSDENVSPQGGESFSISRRRFLEAAGFTFSLAAFSGCGRAPSETALPFTNQPEGVVPGRNMSYATTCAGCPANCGILATVRDGRPLKMEGLPEHPVSRGGLCAVGQASPLELYDSHRLTHPLMNGEESNWDEVDSAIAKSLEEIADTGGAVRFVTSTITSPTLQASIDGFLQRFPDSRHVMFDALSSSAILDAHRQTHGIRVLPHYKFEQAKVIVSFGADFLGTWISPVEFTAAWRTHRIPTASHPEMSHHIQLEGRMSLTGSNADKRYRISPDDYGSLLTLLYNELASTADQPPIDSESGQGSPDVDIPALADRLWNARGESLVVSDCQDVAVQCVVNAINQLLGNYGKTIDIERPSRQRQGNDRDLLELIEELQAGKVAAMFVAGSDLTHNLPLHDELAEAIRGVDLVVSFADRNNDFGSLANFVCPDHHALESWIDSEPIDGVVSLTQPMLQPLGGTRSILESLARWSGRNDSSYEILRSHWQQSIFPRSNGASFPQFWDQTLHDGIVTVKSNPRAIEEFRFDAIQPLSESARGDFCLTLYHKIGLTDSRHAHNPWLQELPDPITKVTWDNYVCISPATAEALGVTNGDMVRVATASGDYQLELPALLQAGQHDKVLAIALAYGVKGTDRFANVGPDWLEAIPTVAEGELVGKNAAGFIETTEDSLRYNRADVTLEKVQGHRELATTQEHHSSNVPPSVAPHGAEVRESIQETSLAAFSQDSSAGTPEVHHHSDVQLWPEDHPKAGHRWGMAIDLNACTGCSACLIACQSENNVPVVGQDEVRRQREMHWIRIDRYYSGDGGEVEVAHQPMMCQHCDNAPCETVCPVLATVHNEEGLNEQVYNRCVGTRYCANNCPYKVRRFNWFEYPRDDTLQNLALNPDVTVRSRGVMEKCSMCVQRINEGKIEAKSRNEPLADGQIQTACQQSCPAQAIVFGDMNDSKSAISTALKNPRRYGLLEEFNFRPSVSYQRLVRNNDGEIEGDEHV